MLEINKRMINFDHKGYQLRIINQLDVIVDTFEGQKNPK